MIDAYPLQWPGHRRRTPNDERKPAAFGTSVHQPDRGWNTKKKLSIAEALHRLITELDKYTRIGHAIRVPKESIVVSSDVPIRKDGLPYSNMREPVDPGVAVYFKLDGKDYCLPCDKWDKVADNIAAIAAHVCAMRGIERWGVGESHDVYTGFKALPEKSSADHLTWWNILGVPVNADESAVKEAYRSLSKKYHPDTSGTGDSEKFIQIKLAYEHAMRNF